VCLLSLSTRSAAGLRSPSCRGVGPGCPGRPKTSVPGQNSSADNTRTSLACTSTNGLSPHHLGSSFKGPRLPGPGLLCGRASPLFGTKDTLPASESAVLLLSRTNTLGTMREARARRTSPTRMPILSAAPSGVTKVTTTCMPSSRGGCGCGGAPAAALPATPAKLPPAVAQAAAAVAAPRCQSRPIAAAHSSSEPGVGALANLKPRGWPTKVASKGTRFSCAHRLTTPAG
jgi:hypothetical protein